MLATLGLAGTPTAAADPVVSPETVTADALATWQINGVVWSQALVGNTVYVTGSFTKARPPGVPVGGAGEIDALNIFAFDITTGNRVPFEHSLNAQGMVVRANPSGSRLYVGGDFTVVDGQARAHVAVFDTATGALVDDFVPRTDGQVRGFGFAGSTVYVGGNFRAANSQPRKLLAAFDAGTGALLPWAPTVDNGYVWSMVTSPDGSRVIVGGSFTTLNGVAAYGMGAVNGSTGATEAWAANLRLRTAGDNGAISSLSTDGVQVYGTGYAFGAGAQFEGTFGADPYTGEVKWVNDCLGDTYDIFAIGQVAYNVSHRHSCENIGSFPDTNPRNRWIKASADRTFPIGTITKPDAYGWNFTGLPYSGTLHWYPDLEFGTYTSSRQAAWSVVGNSDYVVLGGEFPKVNGVAQQGLVRFTKRPTAPKVQRPINNAAFAPAPVSTESGRVRVPFSSVWDRDSTTITYDLYRSPGTRIATFTRNDSEFWSLPWLTHTDTGQTPGASVRYQVRAKDSDGNIQWSAWSPYITVSGAAPSAYAGAVRSGGASHLWRLGEPSGGSTLVDEIGDLHGAPTSVTLGAAGALTGDGTAVTSAGGSTPKITMKDRTAADPAVTVEAWVNTTSTRGGRIVGFGDSATGTSTSGGTDRVLYLDNTGRANFAINDGAYRTVYGRTAVNDGQWHHLAGVVGPEGMQLFVDGIRVGRDQNYTAPKVYSGSWRIGADQTAGFANRPTDAGLAGTIDEVAVFPKASTRAEIQGRYLASGRTGGWGGTPADAYGAEVAGDGPDLYWRLDEPSGAAVDSSGNGAGGTATGGLSRNQAGALSGSPAATFDGSSGLVVAQQSWTAPKAYSAELWFKTTSTRGGKLIGFGNAAGGLSTTYDRHVTMQSDGRLSFGANNGGQQSLVTSGTYHDGQWHHLVATQGSEGMRLWVDTALAGSNTVSGASSYLGHWRVGGDRTWGSTASDYIAGTLDEVAVYPRVLAEQDVRDHFTASGRGAANRPPTASFTAAADDLEISVDGRASTDPDGPVTHAWDFGDGSTGAGPTATHTYAAAGSYTVRLTVSDGPGLTATATRAVTVVANQPPTADFTAEVDDLGLAVDAGGSADTDGSIAGYAWAFGDGTTGSGATDTHTYAAAGTYAVELTVTDDDGATSVRSRSVTVTAPPNSGPEARFTSTADGLVTEFDAADSTDPDGTITGYAWDFGDGANGTGGSPRHTYAASGTYTVELTVTDNRGGTGTVRHDVTVRANQKPVAAFTSSANDLRATFDASGSTDADGSVVGYAWEFGDGTTGTGSTAAHTYAAAGTYAVTLTVTDDDGVTDTVTREVTVTAPTVFGRDAFGRSAAGGWGSADLGGAWTIPTGASRYSVAGGVGRVSLTAGAGTTANLGSVSATNVETRVAVSFDKAATGSGQYASVIGRSVGASGSYQAKLRVLATGAVSLTLVKVSGGTETTLSTTTVPGMSYTAGDTLRVRFQVTGTSPTALRAKVWKSTASEPTGWTVTANDSTSGLQTAGSVGLYSYLSGSATNAPLVVAYDDFWAGVPE